MTLDIYALGNRIRSARKRKGVSQSDLSEIIDKSPTYLSYIESGTKTMSLDTFVDLANALNVTADELLRDSLEKTALGVYAMMTDDSSEYEQRILRDLIEAVKQSLRSNAVYYSKNHR
ncbi:MAG: helix-turn-helix transcriptional regulator [Parasporobacterium sp.]|nr:helix-turn-helix transcriptional regulator [Parasporobacterium sp.]